VSFAQVGVLAGIFRRLNRLNGLGPHRLLQSWRRFFRTARLYYRGVTMVPAVLPATRRVRRRALELLGGPARCVPWGPLALARVVLRKRHVDWHRVAQIVCALRAIKP